MVLDWYDEGYYREGQLDPQGPHSGSNRVNRSGSAWDCWPPIPLVQAGGAGLHPGLSPRGEFHRQVSAASKASEQAAKQSLWLQGPL